MTSSSLAASSALLCLLLAPPASAATIRVPTDQPTIQAAIDVAVTGDVVLVAAGIYVGSGNKDLDLQGKAIAVRSENGPALTTIDCEGSGRGFRIFRGETSETVIEGFTIRRGAPDPSDQSGGGAILIIFTSPTILNCVFVENSVVITASNGGGGAICCRGSGSEIRNCEFRDNTVTTTGPAANGHGAGLAAFASAIRVIDCMFEHNRSLFGDGGGAYVYPFADQQTVAGSSSLHGCTFVNNEAARNGGGLWIVGDVSVIGCIVTGNHAGGQGGGMGGGLGVAVEECTLVGNTAPAGSSVCSQGIAIHNSILAFGGPGPAVECLTGISLGCTDIYGHAGGDWVGCIASQLGVNGNIGADPRFCAQPGDLQLCTDSPCAPEHSGACGLIGALGVGCSTCGPTAVSPATWGRIKAEADCIR